MSLENDKLLLKKNVIKANTKNIIIKGGHAIFQIKDEEFSGKSIKKLIALINTLNTKYAKVKMPIIIDLGRVTFTDKLTYIFLEIICYILIKDYRHQVTIHFNCKPNILTEGIASSPLLLLRSGEKDNIMKYMIKFHDDIYKNHYRKILKKTKNKIELSRKMDEISYFLKYSGVSDECIEELSEVIVELIGNAWEHASSECLVDLDVTNSYFNPDENQDNQYLGINIAVVNFSEELLGDAIKRKISNPELELTDRYNLVRETYERHKNFFDSIYQEKDFFNISSFQHKISGRENKASTGGTGLTKLIASLEKRSDAHKCYLITGDRALWFFHQYLEYDMNGWIGFNEANDFLKEPPSCIVTGSNSIFMPGTAYNLNFIMKRREETWIM